MLFKDFFHNYTSHPTPNLLIRRIFLKGLIYTFSVLALRFFAHQVNLPDFPEKGLLSIMGRPESWRFFVCGLIPLGFCLQSIFTEAFVWWILGKHQEQSMIKAKCLRALSVDSWSLLALPLLGIIIILHHNLAQWALLAGMLFFFVLLSKLFFISGILWSLAQEGKSTFSDKHFLSKITWGLALSGFIFLTSLGFWTNQAVSTAGDEPAYLINSQRVAAALVPGSTLEAKQGKDRFYWGRWSKKLAQPLARSPLFVSALAPMVKISGRLGGIALNSVGAGLCLALFFYLATQLGYTPRTSLLATGLFFAGAPFLQLSQHIYPGIFGILFTLAGMILLTTENPSRITILKLAGVILAISLVKLRFSPVALAMALAAAYLWLPWPAKKARGLILFSSVVLVFSVLLMTLGYLFMPQPMRTYLASHANIIPPDPLLMLASIPAMFFDQEFGLLAYAPSLALGLIGLGCFWQRKPKAGAVSLWLGLANLISIVVWRWNQWDGGFTAPGRFLAPCIPLLLLWTLPLLRKTKSLAWQTIITLLSGSTILISMILALVPQWRYHRRTGVNNLFLQISDHWESLCHRFFPSFINRYLPEMLPALFWGLVIFALGFFYYRFVHCRMDDKPDTSRHGKKPAFLALGIGLVFCLTLVTAGRYLPTDHFQAEAMQRKGAILYGAMFNQPMYLILGKTGASASTKVIWGEETQKIILNMRYVPVGKRKKGPAARPVPALEIAVDHKPVARLKVGSVKIKDYELKVKAEPGPRLITITCLSQSGRDQVALDRISLTD